MFKQKFDQSRQKERDLGMDFLKSIIPGPSSQLQEEDQINLGKRKPPIQRQDLGVSLHTYKDVICINNILILSSCQVYFVSFFGIITKRDKHFFI